MLDFLFNDENLLNGVVASLIAWVLSIVITAVFSFLYSGRVFQQRFTKMVNESLSGLSNAIKHASPKDKIYAISDAEKIVELFDIHTSNYSSIEKIVKNDQIEDIREFLNQSEPDSKLIRDKLIKLNATWGDTVRAIQKSQRLLDKELGLKR